MNVLIILQGPPYGNERAYNGLRLAGNLAKRDGVTAGASPDGATITSIA